MLKAWQRNGTRRPFPALYEAWLTEQGTLSALVTSSNQRAKWHFFRVRGEQADKIATGNSPRDFTKYFGRLSC